MKTWITTLAIATITLLGASPGAEAKSHRHYNTSRQVYISGYRSCGTPIYTEKYFVGYDRCGRPVWNYRIVEAPRHYRPVPPPRYYAAPPCPPPAPAYGGYRDGGIIISGSFRL